MKRIFIIHCWGGTPADNWYPWLASALEAKGYAVTVPDMPDTETPAIDAWVHHLKDVVGTVDEQTFFVGHSIGCQTILRYLASLPAGTKAGGAAFVAGWFHLTRLESDEEWAIAKPWLETPIDLAQVKEHAQTFHAIFSDNDPFVPLSDKDIFEKELGASTVVMNEKGHFTGDDGVMELPEVLDTLSHMAQ